MLDDLAAVQLVYTSDHLVDGAESELGHDLSQMLGYKKEIVDHILRFARELAA
jgi:hypothetical protein